MLFFIAAVIVFARKNSRARTGSTKLQMALVFAATAFLLLYGTENMEIVTPHRMTYTSPKLQESCRVVFFADLHYGSSQSTKVVDKAFSRIRYEAHDYLLLGGDIVYEHTEKAEMEEIFRKIAEIGADLLLSGHTHDGQMFPLHILYSLIGLNTCGEYQIGGTRLYVTPGIAGWYLPFRTESHCWYEVIDLEPGQ